MLKSEKENYEAIRQIGNIAIVIVLFCEIHLYFYHLNIINLVVKL